MSQLKEANPQKGLIAKAVEATQAPNTGKQGDSESLKPYCVEKGPRRTGEGLGSLREHLGPFSSCGSFTRLSLGQGPDIRMIPRMQTLSYHLVKGPVVG